MANKFHFIGIGGIGMSALAQILLDKQLSVSGSDLSSNFNTEQLQKKGASIFKGHAADHICSGDTVVVNSQIQKNNPEYQAALKLKCPILHRSELLAELMGGHQTLAVTGTHGKTTTTSLLTAVLIEGGADPTFAVGGMLQGLNGKWGRGKYFVAEADESDGSFLHYRPEGAIITNIGHDHLDYYKSEEALKNAFRTFISQVQNEELLFYCGDDAELARMASKGISYGFGPHNQLHISHFKQEGWHHSFTISFEGKVYTDIRVALIGEHNALNAAAVFGLSLKIGIAEEKIRAALAAFPGVGRRCEKRGEVREVLLLDDYGHHPTEIKKTLFAVKTAIQARRLVVVFQPHRYSRMKELFHQFTKAFEIADFVYVTDIYAAMEEPIEGVTALGFLEALRKESTVPCAYLPKERWCEELRSSLMPHDVLLTVGAGDITRLHSELIQDFLPEKIKVGLIFGGKSCEHEISLRSSRFVSESLNPNLYEIHYFGIDKEGRWLTGQEAKEQLATQTVISSPNARSILDPQVTSALENCSLLIPILHGTFGEDGTIQGLFEMLGKPYVGPDYRAAAICMDKVLTKRLVETAGVKTPKDVSFSHLNWLLNREALVSKISETLPLPVYVKPVHLGSSVGITCVNRLHDLGEAIDLAFRFDTQVLVEEGKVDCRELEFAVLGNTYSFPVIAPGPGEKLAQGEFVDYEKKYGSQAIQTTLNPEMPPEILEKGKELARRAYEAVGCSGMTRVDFLLDKEGEYWLFEMNPIPGLQKLSLFPKIWNREGVAPAFLFDRLVVLALERHRKQNRHITTI